MKALDIVAAERFARLALDCVQREYPSKISHVLNRDADVQSPRRLTPAFYGCYDWHSAVHNHWLLVRLARLFPQARFSPEATLALRLNLAPANIAGEVVYLNGEGRASFERPYGLAWLLLLCQELHEWENPLARELGQNLQPLEQAAKERLKSWLPRLLRPVRTGEHSQTAFALGLMNDYARSRNEQALLALLHTRTRDFYLQDKSYPFAYEPSGEDFLSPGLAEADLMRRGLPPHDFAGWLENFLNAAGAPPLTPTKSPDPGDPKFSHLDGLNLSRAWMLEGIATGLPPGDSRVAALLASAQAHADAGLAAITGQHYVSSHWLGTFAVYLLTGRGIPA